MGGHSAPRMLTAGAGDCLAFVHCRGACRDRIHGSRNRRGDVMRPEVLVLGAVGVRCEGRLHQPSSGLARAVLALLAEAGDAGVPEGRLVEVVWGESACGSAVTVAVHRLRRWL